MAKLRVLVVGGGLAGLTASVLMAERGAAVTLLERRTRLGGRTHALRESEMDAVVDNGQHVLLAGYARTRDFLRRIGTADALYFPPEMTLVFRDPRFGPAWVRAPRLPGPLARLAPLVALLRLPNVPLRDRVPSARLVRELVGLAGGVPRELDAITADAWLVRMAVPASLRRAFWDPFVISTLNEKPERVSAYLLAAVLRWGFLAGADAGRLGYPTVDLDALFVTPTLRHLRAHGAVVRTGCGLASLRLDGGRVVAAVTTEGETLTADAFVLALPPAALTRVLAATPLAAQPFFARAAGIQSAPIVAVNVWLDGPLHTLHPFEGLLDCAIEWVFDRGKMHGRPTGPGHYYTLIVSASWQLQGATQAEVLAAAMASLRLHYPEIAGLRVLHQSVVRHPEATFSAGPGFEALRCSQHTPVPNLFLAGDWTDTGLPSTMESAVESAYRAAAGITRAGIGL